MENDAVFKFIFFCCIEAFQLFIETLSRFFQFFLQFILTIIVMLVLFLNSINCKLNRIFYDFNIIQ